MVRWAPGTDSVAQVVVAVGSSMQYQVKQSRLLLDLRPAGMTRLLARGALASLATHQQAVAVLMAMLRHFLLLYRVVNEAVPQLSTVVVAAAATLIQ